MAKRAGSIADENEQFDTRALIRLSTWGIAAVVAVTTTIFAARSELGTKRVHAAVLSITASPADPPSAVLGQLMARTADVERESRRLSETVRSIGSERERLQVRVGMVEREMGDLTGSITKSADHASFVVTPDKASYSVGDSVTVTATADSGAAFGAGATTSWNHTFVASDAPCPSTVVNPPTTETESTVVVSTPKHKTKTHAAAVTPTVVEAGLVSTSTNDLRGEQGLALMVAGMVMLVGAGGLGLRVRSVASRS